jgi:hypothetical protein
VTPGVLIKVRCKARGCGRLLADMVDAPAPSDEFEWACYVRIPLCQRHGDGAGRGNIAAWKQRQQRAGKDHGRVATHRMVQWAEFRPKVARARATGQTQKHAI